MGDALMGSGVASGENRAVEAAQAAISSPLLEGISIAGAQGVLVNVTGGPNMSLVEVDESVSVIHEAAGDEANVILGAVVDDQLTDEMMVTVIATGFNKRAAGSIRHVKTPSVIDKIPATASDLSKLDEPAYLRKGIDISVASSRTQEEDKEKISKGDPEKPAFLRKIMD
jgi:cell division protein FtsZ